MPTTWTAENERRLLLAIIAVLNPTPPKWDEVAALLGHDFTAEAIRQKWQKMRRANNVELGLAPAGENTPTKAAASPRKRKAGTNTDEGAEDHNAEEQDEIETKPKAGKRVRKGKTSSVADDGGEDEGQVQARKKPAKKAKVKHEEE